VAQVNFELNMPVAVAVAVSVPDPTPTVVEIDRSLTSPATRPSPARWTTQASLT